MPADHNQHSRRPHYHRGRRGPDRRGSERRPQPQPNDASRDQLDIEQIMREIRSRISERHGIDLTNQQIQELAARRLEAILDPRAIKPSLMDELRRAAGVPADTTVPEIDTEPQISESALYDTNSSLLRAIRRLLNPLLKLFFNPRALVDALSAQERAIATAAAREVDQRRQLSEWNALHFEILRRLVTDIARVEIENQQLALRVESLTARVDFNERRVRAFEQTQYAARTPSRPSDITTPASPPPAAPRPESQGAETSPDNAIDGGRRRRRRRRGRRPGTGLPRDMATAPASIAAETPSLDQNEGDDFGDDEPIADELEETEAIAAPLSPIGEIEPPAESREPAPVVQAESEAPASAVSHDDGQAAPSPPDEPETVRGDQT